MMNSQNIQPKSMKMYHEVLKYAALVRLSLFSSNVTFGTFGGVQALQRMCESELCRSADLSFLSRQGV